jgi:carbon-monoxide dehydrogenase medium subunit
MKPPPFDYHVPATVEECLGLLSDFGDDAVLLSGGQSLMPLMRLRLTQPGHVISLRGIDGPLRAIRIEGDTLVIGARVTYAEVEQSEVARKACPGLAKAIALIATPAVRNRGTLCGNLCHADPASELPALALALKARLRLRSQSGERLVAAEDFFLGPYMTDRRGDEMLTEIILPVCAADEVFAIREVTRLRGGFPMAGVAVSLTRGPGTALRAAAVACFGAHAVQIRVPAAEAALTRLGCTPGGIAAAADAIDQVIEPHGDPFASEAYRRAATRTLLRQAVEEACGLHGGAS